MIPKDLKFSWNLCTSKLRCNKKQFLKIQSLKTHTRIRLITKIEYLKLKIVIMTGNNFRTEFYIW